MQATTPVSTTEAASSDPFERAELRAALQRPHLAIPVLLAERRRLMATITAPERCACLMLLMFTSSLLYALPYGFALGLTRLWHVALLYLGSIAICLPSLHVFGAFLGMRTDLHQSVAVGLTIASAAAMFSFGFAPVVAFLSLTMPASSSGVLTGLSALLLGAALLAGVAHLLRTLRHGALLVTSGSGSMLVWLWQALLLFITYRMGLVLGLL